MTEATTTVHLRRIEENDMSVSQALATPVDDTLESSALVPRNGFHLEPRCRICRNDYGGALLTDLSHVPVFPSLSPQRRTAGT